MDSSLFQEFNKVKMGVILSLTKYSISGGEEQNRDAVLNSVLFSWLNPISSLADFNAKYDAFQRVSKIIRDSYLFDLVDDISTDNNNRQEKIKRAIQIYGDITQSEDNKSLMDICGYRLPPEFGDVSFYQHDVLVDKVQFFYDFENRLREIYQSVTQKGAAKK